MHEHHGQTTQNQDKMPIIHHAEYHAGEAKKYTGRHVKVRRLIRTHSAVQPFLFLPKIPQITLGNQTRILYSEATQTEV